MQVTLDRLTKQSVLNLFTDTQITFAPFSFEDTPLSVSIADRIALPTTPYIWLPSDMTTWTVRAAIGNAFLTPVAGSWFIQSGINLTSGTVTTGKRYKITSYIAGDVFTNIGAGSNATDVIFIATGTTPTTWTHSSVLQECTANLDYNASASDVNTALNATAWVTAAGGLTVSGSGTYFFATFTTAGARAQMAGDGDNLAPLSLVEMATLIDGTASLQEVQSIRVLQQPAAYANLTTDSAGPAASVDVLQVGGGGFNHKVRVLLDPVPYDGRFSVTVAGLEIALQAYNVSQGDFQTAIENLQITSGTVVTGRKYKIITFVAGDDFTNIGALSNATGVVFVATGTTPTTWTHESILSPVGAGNVAAFQERLGSYLISFQGDMADTDMGTIAADGSTLLVQSFKSGILSTNTEAMELLLGTEKTITTTFEIEGTPAGGNPIKLFHQDVTLIAPLIHGTNIAGPSIYFYDKAEVDALLLLKADVLVAAKRRFKTDGKVQFWNADQNLYQEITVSGEAGAETINILAGEA